MEALGNGNGIPYSKSGDRDQDEKLLQPFKYILQVPGKQIRAKLAHAFNYWLKIPGEKLNVVGDIVQMLHNSSLLTAVYENKLHSCCKNKQTQRTTNGKERLPSNIKRRDVDTKISNTFRIDDIQDNSILRRGIPVAHSIYGVASTINAANYVLFLALERVLSLGHPDATTVYTEQLLELHRGQGMEIYWRDNYTCPSEDEYLQMTKRKTGGLFMLAVRLMQLFSENQADFTKLTGILGLYFQIRDDYCNLCLQEYAENKSYCEDLTEDILRQRTRDIEMKRYCISLLHKFGSFSYTRQRLEELDAEARAEVTKLGGNPLLFAVLDELLNWKREKDQNNPEQ
ncbi:Geranylgeranyl pyrophosphate synthase [Blattella germanica]|nr:Geranylgeranyl pyrophosphate synthase [Blattella germanica]